MTKPLSRSETKEIVTPYAFAVSADLLGKPLARPARRGVAILIDLFLIGVLSTLSAIILAVFVALTFFRADAKLKQHANSDRKSAWYYTRLLLRGSGAIIVFFAIFFAMQGFDDGNSSPATSAAVEEVSLMEAQEIIETPEMAQIVEHANEPSTEALPSIVKWAQVVLSDLGIGLGWAALYFSVFTAWANGQTVGKKMCGIKVVKLDGTTPNLWESFERYGGYGAGFATGLLGFLQLYWDPNRQAIQDKISETLVLRIKQPKKVKNKIKNKVIIPDETPLLQSEDPRELVQDGKSI
ncbi:MAG: putative RDD family membrane protein YckC [Alphaproteobacteria bacterium]|jgi:uncharacterized RDD family membrane protein YckC